MLCNAPHLPAFPRPLLSCAVEQAVRATHHAIVEEAVRFGHGTAARHTHENALALYPSVDVVRYEAPLCLAVVLNAAYRCTGGVLPKADTTEAATLRACLAAFNTNRPDLASGVAAAKAWIYASTPDRQAQTRPVAALGRVVTAMEPALVTPADAWLGGELAACPSCAAERGAALCLQCPSYPAGAAAVSMAEWLDTAGRAHAGCVGSWRGPNLFVAAPPALFITLPAAEMPSVDATDTLFVASPYEPNGGVAWCGEHVARLRRLPWEPRVSLNVAAGGSTEWVVVSIVYGRPRSGYVVAWRHAHALSSLVDAGSDTWSLYNPRQHDTPVTILGGSSTVSRWVVTVDGEDLPAHAIVLARVDAVQQPSWLAKPLDVGEIASRALNTAVDAHHATAAAPAAAAAPAGTHGDGGGGGGAAASAAAAAAATVAAVVEAVVALRRRRCRCLGRR